MPINYKNYPKNWKAIRAEIMERSGGQCECNGECGLHNGEDLFWPKRRCVEKHGGKAQFAKGKIVLTIAHLNHNPKDSRRANLKAMCQRCHLRYDVEHHKKSAAATRLKKENK